MAWRRYRGAVDETGRHLRLLTETIAAVNSTLDLEEVLSLVASKVADALGADACFVYLYDEQADHAARAVDLVDRVRGDEPAPASEEAAAHSESIGHVGLRPVHRAFDPPDKAPVRVGNQVPRGLKQG